MGISKRDEATDPERRRLRSFTRMGSIVLYPPQHAVHLGDAWEEMFLDDEDEESQVADEINIADVPTVNQFQETLKRTTLETNRQRGVI